MLVKTVKLMTILAVSSVASGLLGMGETLTEAVEEVVVTTFDGFKDISVTSQIFSYVSDIQTAFINHPGVDCKDEETMIFLAEQANAWLQEKYNQFIGPDGATTKWVDGYTNKIIPTNTTFDGNRRKLQGCTSTYCENYCHVCMIAGCGHLCRRKLRTGNVVEKSMEEMKTEQATRNLGDNCVATMEAVADLLGYAHDYYRLSALGITKLPSATCDPTKVFFAVRFFG